MRQGAHKQFAQAVRREMTDAERMLWLHLRRRQLAGFRFRRQHSIGPFVADFACLEAKLVVEVDGSQHAQSSRDEYRDEMLKELGFRVFRFWNDDVLKHTDKVLADILQALSSNCPLPPSGHLPPLFAGEGNQERAPLAGKGNQKRAPLAGEGNQELAGEGY